MLQKAAIASTVIHLKQNNIINYIRIRKENQAKQHERSREKDVKWLIKKENSIYEVTEWKQHVSSEEGKFFINASCSKYLRNPRTWIMYSFLGFKNLQNFVTGPHFLSIHHEKNI